MEPDVVRYHDRVIPPRHASIAILWLAFSGSEDTNEWWLENTVAAILDASWSGRRMVMSVRGGLWVY